MDSKEFSKVLRQRSVKRWRHGYFKLMYQLGHSNEFDLLLFRSFLVFSSFVSVVLGILVFINW